MAPPGPLTWWEENTNKRINPAFARSMESKGLLNQKSLCREWERVKSDNSIPYTNSPETSSTRAGRVDGPLLRNHTPLQLTNHCTCNCAASRAERRGWSIACTVFGSTRDCISLTGFLERSGPVLTEVDCFLRVLFGLWLLWGWPVLSPSTFVYGSNYCVWISIVTRVSSPDNPWLTLTSLHSCKALLDFSRGWYNFNLLTFDFLGLPSFPTIITVESEITSDTVKGLSQKESGIEQHSLTTTDRVVWRRYCIMHTLFGTGCIALFA